ncbi:unnamed protein product [Rotaria socialis]
MVFNIVIYLFYLIQFSFGNECPSFKYCICSSDQTIVQCSNRHLTNELLLKINNQLPKSTIVLNLSSNSLTSIKYLPNLNSLQILDLSFNKIKYLPSNILSKFPRLISFDLQNNSLKAIPHTFQKISNINLNLSNNRFHCTCQFKLFKTKNFFKSILCQNNKQFDENDFCRAKNFLQIYPQQSQIVYENEQFILNCSSNLQHYWTLNHTFYPSTITSFSYSTVIIHHVRTNHSGLWTCHSLDSNQSLWLTVITTPTTYFCPSKQMNTSKGYFYWPRTLMNRRVAKTCPHGTAAWLRNSNEYARAWYTCSSSGQWINFDVSQCAFQTNVSRLMDYLSFNETNVLLRLSKYLSEINQNYLQLNDIILLIDLIDEQKQKYQHQDKIIIIYHLTDFILQIKNDFIYSNEYQNAMGRLRSIIERLLDFTNPSWLYIGKELTAVTVQSLVSCAVPNRSLLTIICNIDHQSHQSQLVTIQFSSDSNKTEQYSLFRIIVYRQSTLFTPNTVGMNNNPVVYIRPVSRNVLSTINLTFYGQSDKSSIGVWYSNQSNWEMNSSICKIDRQDANFTSTNCILLNNDSLSVTYFNNINNSKKLLIYTNYSQLPIYISSIIGSICFFISILVCTCYSEVYQMSRSVFHCLINYWLSLGILLPLFAFGLQKNQLKLLCEFIALTLHYLCLTTIIWLTLLTYAIWSKQSIKSTNKDVQRQSSSSMINDHASKMKSKSKPVIQFYLLAYGTALIICCMNIAVSHQHYMINDINDDAQQFENNSFNEEIQQNSADSPIEFYSGNTKNTQFQLFSTALPRSCTHSKASSAQAIIRVIPIIHFSTSNINGSLSNSSNTIQPDDQVDLSIEQNELIKNARISYSIPASSFANEYDPTYFCLNKTDNLIQQKLSSNEKLSNEKKTVSDHAELAYIDQDDDLSVSLKSSFYESIASLNTLINKNDYPQTLSYASNLSDELGNGVIHANKNLLNESSV